MGTMDRTGATYNTRNVPAAINAGSGVALDQSSAPVSSHFPVAHNGRSSRLTAQALALDNSGVDSRAISRLECGMRLAARLCRSEPDEDGGVADGKDVYKMSEQNAERDLRKGLLVREKREREEKRGQTRGYRTR